MRTKPDRLAAITAKLEAGEPLSPDDTAWLAEQLTRARPVVAAAEAWFELRIFGDPRNSDLGRSNLALKAAVRRYREVGDG